ncbi:MAG: class I SAM-dependent DNA methyltransferase [Chloroflexi bacterium]|nr:class I SAM-dependent DNA methyltransferase [Chloroflexota bacterium]
MSPQEFVAKWRKVTANEKKIAQEHFIDLCHLIGHQTPSEADPKGEWFTFEAGASKSDGGRQGWADVFLRNTFAWEYKGKHSDLVKAYAQLQQYRESLQNPPLLIVSDIDRIEIHTNFTNTVKRAITITLDDLLTPQGVEQIKTAFENPQAFKSQQTAEQVTQQAAKEFAHLAEFLRRDGAESHAAAHFLIRILFCLFAEDIGLLPNKIFTRLVKSSVTHPESFQQRVAQLFAAMRSGGAFGADDIKYFDGGLFNDSTALALDSDGMSILAGVCDLDWSSIEPSILGTLFSRSLDPSERAKLGAQYTSKADILLIVEPVLMAPLRRHWEQVKQQARTIANGRSRNKQNALRDLLLGFASELAKITVLDPACGSGNFLYVALLLLLDLWKEVSVFGSELGLPMLLPDVNPSPSPLQMHGIEINPYAHDLAQTSIWIGYIQWRRDNGFGYPAEPILKAIETIRLMDAILTHDANDKSMEPEWIPADVVVGNPPFLGGNKIRQGLGDKYVDDLFALYKDRVPASADLVTYWFEKARAMIEQDKVKRAGLLATQGIRGGANRKVLERIKETGDIFMAWSDRDWILDGAAVRVSVIGFDNGEETMRQMDGKTVPSINANLTASANLTEASTLKENEGICFRSDEKGGPFDIDETTAHKMLEAKGNPNGRPNSDVVRPYYNARDMTAKWSKTWIIDFGEMSQEQAARYEQPFEYVKQVVKPVRDNSNAPREKEYWWWHRRLVLDTRASIKDLSRYIVTPNVSKHRLFTWFDKEALPDHTLYVIARDDDFFFGVLHSRVHEIWALRMGTALTDRPRYTPTTTFETFPFPFPPGKESKNDKRVKAIAQAAKELVEQRDRWLNPPDIPEADLKKRTLTNLYNARPEWLAIAHRKLDDAVLDAYGWQHNLSDEGILEKLLALNLERAK